MGTDARYLGASLKDIQNVQTPGPFGALRKLACLHAAKSLNSEPGTPNAFA
jgi:hypothetical protein